MKLLDHPFVIRVIVVASGIFVSAFLMFRGNLRGLFGAEPRWTGWLWLIVALWALPYLTFLVGVWTKEITLVTAPILLLASAALIQWVKAIGSTGVLLYFVLHLVLQLIVIIAIAVDFMVRSRRILRGSSGN